MFLYLLYLFATPALVMLLARKWTWIDKVSPMAWIQQPGLLAANNLIGNICIPLSIPLMLLACNLSGWSTGKALKAGLCGFTAVVIVTVAGFFLFRGNSDPRQFAQVCAVAIGIYTGGIPNMGAIARGVGMDPDTYLYITSYDLIVTGLYLVFVICFFRQASFEESFTIVFNKRITFPNIRHSFSVIDIKNVLGIVPDDVIVSIQSIDDMVAVDD